MAAGASEDGTRVGTKVKSSPPDEGTEGGGVPGGGATAFSMCVDNSAPQGTRDPLGSTPGFGGTPITGPFYK